MRLAHGNPSPRISNPRPGISQGLPRDMNTEMYQGYLWDINSYPWIWFDIKYM